MGRGCGVSAPAATATPRPDPDLAAFFQQLQTATNEELESELELYRSADGCQAMAIAMAGEIVKKYGASIVLKQAVTEIAIADSASFTLKSTVIRVNGSGCASGINSLVRLAA